MSVQQHKNYIHDNFTSTACTVYTYNNGTIKIEWMEKEKAKTKKRLELFSLFSRKLKYTRHSVFRCDRLENKLV